jgi:outer membrane protease
MSGMSKPIHSIALVASVLSVALAWNPDMAGAEGAPKAFELTTATSFGMLYGMANEFVYNQDVSADYKNSELDWPFAPLAYAGATLSLDTKIGIVASLSLRQGLSGKTGTMTDSDFLNGDGVKTHLSESDCYTERALLLDLNAGYELPISGAWRLKAFVGLSYMDFKWSARDGYYQYPGYGSAYTDNGPGSIVPGTLQAWSATETKTPIYGTGILYEQAYVLGLLGLGASYSLGRSFTLGASFSLAPLAYCYTEDNHELRTIDFYSRLSGGVMLEPALSARYLLKQGASLRFDLAYRQVGKLKGDITQVNEGTSSTSSVGNYYAGPDSASTGTGDSGSFISMLDASLSFALAY